MYSKLVLIPLLFITIFSINGCFLKMIAGADIDAEQFKAAREAKMLEIKTKYSEILADKISKGALNDNSDITLSIGPSLINKIASQYDSTKGWLNPENSYIIKGIKTTFNYGSCIATINLTAHNYSYNVNVDLTLDCLITLEIINNELVMQFEPYNISPVVTAKGLLSSAEEVIANLIKINLANLNKNFPPVKIPISIKNYVNMQGTQISVTDKVNMLINSPSRNISYALSIKDILIFKEKVLVYVNTDNIEVK